MDTIGTLARGRRSTASRLVLAAGTAAVTMAKLASAALQHVEMMLEKRRSRLALLELTDEQLKDIGISRADACREAAKRLWD